MRTVLERDRELIPAKEEKLHSLRALKQNLIHDRSIVIAQIASVAGIGVVDTASLCQDTELLELLRRYDDRDKDVKDRTLNFVMKSKTDEEKDLLKRAAIAAGLPLDINCEKLKFHLSVAQRVKEVEIKITTSHVPVHMATHLGVTATASKSGLRKKP